jgi:hypothetical protein
VDAPTQTPLAATMVVSPTVKPFFVLKVLLVAKVYYPFVIQVLSI